MNDIIAPQVGRRPAAGRLAIGLAMIAGLASPAVAQVGEFPPGEYQIEGVRAACPEVTTVVRNRTETLIDTPDAYTVVVNAGGFAALPPGVRLFIYYQTCGFMFYQDMALADGVAVREGVAERWLSAADVETMCETTLLVDAGWLGAPDPARCAGIYQLMREALQ